MKEAAFDAGVLKGPCKLGRAVLPKTVTLQ